MKALGNVIVACLLLLISISSCKRDDRDKLVIACTAQVMPEYLNFRLVDKNTNADLFFANQPAYTISQLKVTYKKLDKLVQVKSDGVSGNYFSIQVNIASFKDTLYIQVANSPAVPLIYTLAKVEDPCPRYPVSTVLYNNTSYTNVGSQILALKQ